MPRLIPEALSLLFLLLIAGIAGFMWWEGRQGAFPEHYRGFDALDVSSAGLVVAATDEELQLWKGKYFSGSMKGHEKAIKSVAFSGDGRYVVSGSIDRTVRVWLVEEQRVVARLEGHTGGANRVLFACSDSLVVSAGYDNTIRIWDWRAQKELKQLHCRHTIVDLDSANHLLYVDSACALTVYSLNRFRPLASWGGYCVSPAFVPRTDLLVAASDSGRFLFLNRYTGQVTQTLQTNQYKFAPFAVTPDGRYLVSSGISELEVWDWRSQAIVHTLQNINFFGDRPFAFAGPDRLVVASGGLQTWDLGTGKPEQRAGSPYYRSQLQGLLSLAVLLALVVGMAGVWQSSRNRFSAFTVAAILSVWSFGLLAVAIWGRKYLLPAAEPLLWVFSIVSGLAVLSLYGAVAAVFTLPFSLYAGYVLLQAGEASKRVILLVAFNLFLLGVLVSFIVSAGLWR